MTDSPRLTRPEVSRYLGVTATRLAYGISKGWLQPCETTFLGTELFLLSDVLRFAAARGIKVPGAEASIAS